VYANRLSYAFADPVAVELLAGITEVAEAAGAGLVLVPGSASADSKTTAMSAALIDGLIVNSLADDDPLLTTAIARRLALVVIDQPDPVRLAQLGAPDTPWVGVDDRAAAVTLAEQAAQLALTTIRQPTRRKGTLATEALLERLAGHTPHRRRQLPAKLAASSFTASRWRCGRSAGSGIHPGKRIPQRDGGRGGRGAPNLVTRSCRVARAGSGRRCRPSWRVRC
jgi:DNA-binding LacI/PurR family transcriptional regulator